MLHLNIMKLIAILQAYFEIILYIYMYMHTI